MSDLGDALLSSEEDPASQQGPTGNDGLRAAGGELEKNQLSRVISLVLLAGVLLLRTAAVRL